MSATVKSRLRQGRLGKAPMPPRIPLRAMAGAMMSIAILSVALMAMFVMVAIGIVIIRAIGWVIRIIMGMTLPSRAVIK